MKKNFKNILSIGILIFILCALIITVTTLSKGSTLSTGSDGNTNSSSVTNEKTFEYINSKLSLNQNVSFENNFGGTNTDQVKEVFKLNNYYLIGTTESTDNYFNGNKTNAVFVLICDYSGNPINVYCHEEKNEITFVSSKIFRNSIYILINCGGTKLLEFNLSDNKLEVVYSGTSESSDLIISNEPIVACQQNAATEFYFVLSKFKYCYPQKITNIVMASEYLNGTLVMFNTLSGFEIGLLTTTNFSSIKTFAGYSLNKLNITDKNFVLEVSNNNENKIMILDLSFNLECEFTFENATNTELLYINNVNYLFYQSNSNLKLITFCNHADKLTETQIDGTVKNFKVLLLNNNFVVLSEKVNKSLNLLKLDMLGNISNQAQVMLNTNFEVICFTENSTSNYFVVGNFENINQIISNNFGKTDVFVCELKF